VRHASEDGVFGDKVEIESWRGGCDPLIGFVKLLAESVPFVLAISSDLGRPNRPALLGRAALNGAGWRDLDMFDFSHAVRYSALRAMDRTLVSGEVMDVSMPITTVVPSLDGPVLAALAATTRPMGLAVVHTRAGRGSKSGVRSVLLRMSDVGLVQEVPGGYVLNRDHIAAPAVELLATLHGELTNRIRSAVEEWSTAPSLVGVFGSTARRDGDADSDIDVLVVSDDPDLDDRVDELAEQIRRWTGNRAQVVGRTTKEIARLRRAKEPILSEWTRDLVVIAGERAALGKMA